MKLKTLIIDDEPIALEKLRNYVERMEQLQLVAMCSDGVEGLKAAAAVNPDLIITDINMPDLNGVDFIKSLPDRPMVIFTTAYADYAVDGFKLSAVDYLLKPYGFAEFAQAVNKAVERRGGPGAYAQPDSTTPDASGSIFVKTDHRFVRVDPAEIIYIKGYGEYLQIYVAGKQNPLVTLSSFSAIKQKLTGDFVQIHRSYIVNMNRVEMVDRNRIIINPTTELPVGDSYKAALQEYLLTHSVGKISK